MWRRRRHHHPGQRPPPDTITPTRTTRTTTATRTPRRSRWSRRYWRRTTSSPHRTATGSPSATSWRSTSPARRGRARRRCSNGPSASWAVDGRYRSSKVTRRRCSMPSASRRPGHGWSRSTPAPAATSTRTMVRRALDTLDPHPRFGPVHRERRQSGLPGTVRSRRALQSRRHLGDRGRRQAAEVSAHVRCGGLVVINKFDLLPYVDFDLRSDALAYAQSINPGVEMFTLSATTGAGIAAVVRLDRRCGQSMCMSQESVDKTMVRE